MASLLIIVSRTEPSRFTYLKHVFASERGPARTGHHQRSPDVRLGAGEARVMSARLDELASPAVRPGLRVGKRELLVLVEQGGVEIAKSTRARIRHRAQPELTQAHSGAPSEGESEAMSEGANCLIIVPRDQPGLYDRLRGHFSQRATIQVRLDARTGERAASDLNVVAVGGGSLHPDLRAYVEAEIRSLCRR